MVHSYLCRCFDRGWPVRAIQSDNRSRNPEDLWKWNLWRSSLQEHPSHHAIQCKRAGQRGPGAVSMCVYLPYVFCWICVFRVICEFIHRCSLQKRQRFGSWWEANMDMLLWLVYFRWVNVCFHYSTTHTVYVCVHSSYERSGAEPQICITGSQCQPWLPGCQLFAKKHNGTFNTTVRQCITFSLLSEHSHGSSGI